MIQTGSRQAIAPRRQVLYGANFPSDPDWVDELVLRVSKVEMVILNPGLISLQDPSELSMPS